MLYWGIFTSGFIVGGVFASFIFVGKVSNKGKVGVNTPPFYGDLDKNNPNKLFDRLTQINYPPQRIKTDL